MGGLYEAIRGVVLQSRRQPHRAAGVSGRDRKRQGRGRVNALVHHRGLRLEPMEERALLSAGLQFDHVIYNPHAGQRLHLTTASVISPAAAAPLSSPAPVGMTPQMIRTAYGINSIMLGGVSGTGAGQTIAIIDAYDDPDLVDSTASNFDSSDLHLFDVEFGLPDPPSFLKLNQTGGTTLPVASGSTGWSVEESLDVEWAHAIAPQANIILFEANSNDDSDLITTAVNTARNWPGVTAISMSFGESESNSDASEESVFSTPSGHPGVTFLASTGDSAAPGGFPAFSPNVVAVGGTTLTINSSTGAYVSETGWSDSGGGESQYEAEPSYQEGVQKSGMREIPDVSFDADPNSGVAIRDSYDYGSSDPWIQVGGTSVSSPCWAGLVAIADQLRSSQGLGSLDGPTETLPYLYALNAADFHDITSGNNGYPAGPGYDMVTGIGSPRANALVPDLASFSAPDLTVAATHSGNFTQGDVGDTYTITVGNAGNAATSGTVSLVDSLPSGLTATAFSGPGWTTNLATLTATRNDALAAGVSYPALTLTVNVAANAPTSVINTATVSGGGEVYAGGDTATDPTTIIQLVDLSITSTHSGIFQQGDVGDTYTITVDNLGCQSSAGLVTVVDTLPASLTATAFSGSGWTTDLATLTATRSDPLASGASYPPLTITVNVAVNAPVVVTNTATVSGGGETNTANDTAIDPTSVGQWPDLAVRLSHSRQFQQGDIGDAYTITVSNAGLAPTDGVVNVVDTLPAGLTATAMSGTGWTTNLATLSASRSDVLAGGTNYPALTLTVNVAAGAPATAINVVAVSGGGELNTANDTASDATSISNGLASVSSTTPSLDGGTMTAGATTLAVNFNVAVLGAGAAANYQLQSLGLDGLLGTADDTIVPLSASYSGTTATLTFPALTESTYRLTVRDAITDLTGRSIDGDGDGKPGGDYLEDFEVLPAVNSPRFPSLVISGCGGTNPTCMLAADFNGDGKEDLVVGTATTLSILWGNGAGGFSSTTTYDFPYATTSLAVGDFNNDGNLDLVAGHSYLGLTVLLGDGHGGFSAPRTFDSGGPYPYSIAVGDFNGDGNLDLAVANNEVDFTVDILLGDGQGNFSAPTDYTTGGQYPYSVVAADFNHDGKVDLAVANGGSENVGILLGDGKGGFSAPTTFYSGGYYPYSVATGDFNGDGNADLVVANNGSQNIGVLLGDGKGGFSGTVTYPVAGNFPWDVVVADLNQDGKQDVAVADETNIATNGFADIFWGNGDGTFSSGGTCSSGGEAPHSIAVGDFDGDGLPDLVMGNEQSNTVGVLLNAPAFAAATNLISPNDDVFTVQIGHFGAGQLVQGADNVFNGVNRLQVVGADYAPAALSLSLTNGGRTVNTAAETLAGLTVSRAVTVPSVGNQDFARTIDSFSNPTGAPISTTVTVLGNLGSDAATTVFATSGGGTTPEPSDQWIGTDDSVDSGGTPAIIDYIHGPGGLQPSAVAVIGDNVEWSYNLTVPAGQTVELATLTIESDTRAGAIAEAGALVSPTGFGGQAGAFLSAAELASLANFQFQVPDLAIAKTHSGNFKLGDSGDTYTINVSNVGSAPTSGAVSVVDALPAGLTATGFSGSGWTTNLATLSAARNDALPAGQTYPPLTLTVNVALDAPANVTNTATVSGGGDVDPANNTANDPTTIAQLIDLTVAGTHSGTFRQGDSGDTYTLTVSNVGLLPTSGAVSLVDALPTGLVATSFSGSGWTTNLATLSAARNDALAAGGSYPVLTLTVNVAANAPANVVNTATVSGGGETNTANDTASDPTVIVQVADMAIASAHVGNFEQGDIGDTYTITVSNVGPGPTVGAVSVADLLPAGLTATEFAGAGWTTNLSTLSATRTDLLAPGAAYPALTLTVNVSATAPASVTNMATVSGGGELNTSNDTATDPTTIVSIPPFIAGITPSLAGGMLLGGVKTLVISFNEVMVGAGTAANYSLCSQGPDGLIGTADDTVVSLSVGYSGTTATLTFPPLPPAVYRLTVSDAITDTGGRELDGNGDGLPGSNYVRDFTVVALSSSLSFSSPTSIVTGLSAPRQIIAADFNHDGNPDLAVVNQSSNSVSILLGTGSGGFSAPVSYSTGGSTPQFAVAGDFNHDGNLDLAVSNSGSGNIGVLLGNAKGGFSTAVTYSSGGSSPSALLAADLNGDNKLDLVVANYESDTVGVLLGNGSGGFSAATTFNAAGGTAYHLALGDFNGDGNLDLAVVGLSSSTVSILFGNGAGGFSAPTTLTYSGSTPSGIAAADLNGDGKIDLAVTTMNGLYLFFGNGAGGFTQQPMLSTGGSMPGYPAITDINEDGRPDIVVSNAFSDNVAVLLGDGAGNFSAPATFAVGKGNLAGLAVADINNDGKPDLVVVDWGYGTVYTLENTPPPAVTTLDSPDGFAFGVDSADFGAGQLVEGTNNAFDGLNRLQVGGADYQPLSAATTANGGRTVVPAAQTLAGLSVSRQVTVPATGSQDFARTVDSFTNSTGSPITTTVKIVGDLGSGADTTVFATSDGTGIVSPNDQWIGTDGGGSPAMIHYIRGPAGLQPTSVAVTGSNISWTYNITVPAGQTVTLAYFTILSSTQAGAIAAANALVSPGGFGGQAGAFLSATQLSALANFLFPPAATVALGEHSPLTNDGLTATATDSDPYGKPVTLTYVWTVNGAVKQTFVSTALTDSFNLSVPGNGDKGDTIVVAVTPNDGIVSGAAVTDTATVADTPSVATVVLNEHAPLTNDLLIATATKSDADGDPVSLTFVWTVDGTVKRTFTSATATSDSFDLSTLGAGDAGDTIVVAVTPNDGILTGMTVTDTATVSDTPRVANVVVGSDAWSGSFVSYLAAQNPANAGGYSIPVGSGAQLRPLPWTNIDEIKVTFNENVTVDQTDLMLEGVNTPSYNVAGGTFAYNSATFTATWTLPAAIPDDKLLLELNADGADPIHDALGNRLDGEWTNPVTTSDTGTSQYPSGNGTPGSSNFLFRFNVLPGNVSQDGYVQALDGLLVRGALGSTAGQGNYSIFKDVNGDATVLASDGLLVLGRLGTSLPAGQPMASAFPSAAGHTGGSFKSSPSPTLPKLGPRELALISVVQQLENGGLSAPLLDPAGGLSQLLSPPEAMASAVGQTNSEDVQS